jgi:hypothetical protein
LKSVFPPYQKYDLLWILLLIAILALIIFAWPEPASGAFLSQPAVATEVVKPTVTPTPIPQEYLESADQTSGIICGSVVLVLIIVGGTLGVLRRKNPPQ